MTITSIKRVVRLRLEKGASVENLASYLDHLKNETWKGCPNICAEIGRIREQLLKSASSEISEQKRAWQSIHQQINGFVDPYRTWKTYRTDSGMGGSFNLKYHGMEKGKHIFTVTNKGFEELVFVWTPEQAKKNVRAGE